MEFFYLNTEFFHFSIANRQKMRYNIYGDKMKKQNNICKFITATSNDKLIIKNFVFETQADKIGVLKSLEENAIYLVTNGSGIFQTDAIKKEICAGNIFFSFSHLPFKIENRDNINFMYISFEGGRCEELFTRFGITPNNCIFEGHEGLTSFWQNSLVKANENNLDLISEAVLLYTLGEMVPTRFNENEKPLNVIKKYIEDNFTNSELSLSVAAEAIGYNSKYISRIFKREMGISFSSYLTNLRIQNAIFLIEQGVTAIKNVALLSGYKDPLYFSNVFKNMVGMSPTDYINKKHSI